MWEGQVSDLSAKFNYLFQNVGIFLLLWPCLFVCAHFKCFSLQPHEVTAYEKPRMWMVIQSLNQSQKGWFVWPFFHMVSKKFKEEAALGKNIPKKTSVRFFFFFFFAQSGAFQVHGMCTLGWSRPRSQTSESLWWHVLYLRVWPQASLTPFSLSPSPAPRPPTPAPFFFISPSCCSLASIPSSLSDLPSHHADSHWPDAAPATPGHPAAAAERRWGWENITTLYTSRISPCVIDTQRKSGRGSC